MRRHCAQTIQGLRDTPRCRPPGGGERPHLSEQGAGVRVRRRKCAAQAGTQVVEHSKAPARSECGVVRLLSADALQRDDRDAPCGVALVFGEVGHMCRHLVIEALALLAVREGRAHLKALAI